MPRIPARRAVRQELRSSRPAVPIEAAGPDLGIQAFRTGRFPGDHEVALGIRGDDALIAAPGRGAVHRDPWADVDRRLRPSRGCNRSDDEERTEYAGAQRLLPKCLLLPG